jgi:hypothetical protein
VQRLLENDVIGQHCYQADSDDPDLCQPFATCLWELIVVLHRQEPSSMDLCKSLLDKTSIPFSSSEPWNQSPSPELTNDILMPELTQMRRKYRLHNSVSTPFLESLERMHHTIDVVESPV